MARNDGGPRRKGSSGKGSRVREGDTLGARLAWGWESPGVLIVRRETGEPIMPITPCDTEEEAQGFITELCADGVYALGELATVAFERLGVMVDTAAAEPPSVGRSAAKPPNPLH